MHDRTDSAAYFSRRDLGHGGHDHRRGPDRCPFRRRLDRKPCRGSCQTRVQCPCVMPRVAFARLGPIAVVKPSLVRGRSRRPADDLPAKHSIPPTRKGHTWCGAFTPARRAHVGCGNQRIMGRRSHVANRALDPARYSHAQLSVFGGRYPGGAARSSKKKSRLVLLARIPCGGRTGPARIDASGQATAPRKARRGQGTIPRISGTRATPIPAMKWLRECRPRVLIGPVAASRDPVEAAARPPA